MKSIIALILSGSLAGAAEPLTLKLDYKQGRDHDYAGQIQKAFTKLLASDGDLAEEFAKFQGFSRTLVAPPPTEERQSESQRPAGQSATLPESKPEGGNKTSRK